MKDLTIPFIPPRYQRTAEYFVDSLNSGRLTLYERKGYEDEDGITRFAFVKSAKDIPCRLSYQDKESTTENEPAEGNKDVRVITAPDFFIPTGSIIEITFGGVTTKYKRVGRTHHNDFRNSTPLTIYEEHVVSKEYNGTYEFEE